MSVHSLNGFYRDYQLWLDVGAPDGVPYHRDYGLCSNLRFFYVEGGECNTSVLLEVEMQDQFEAAGMCQEQPFDEDFTSYSEASRLGNQHLNPKRLEWVKNHL